MIVISKTAVEKLNMMDRRQVQRALYLMVRLAGRAKNWPKVEKNEIDFILVTGDLRPEFVDESVGVLMKAGLVKRSSDGGLVFIQESQEPMKPKLAAPTAVRSILAR